MNISSSEPSAASWSLDGQRVLVPRLAAGLYIVATPIGNLADITLRALSTLAAADLILAEDTRVARRLLAHYAIQTPLRRFDAHASPAQIAAVLAELASGRSYALISDAGTPLISDPGSHLVMAATQSGNTVYPVPGASAVLAAIASAGIPADRFFFEGFLPPKSGDRRRRLRQLADVPGTLVLYEAPHRILETLEDCRAVLGNRAAATARELTKLYETIDRGSLEDLSRHFENEAPRGEFVVIIAPPGEAEKADEVTIDARLNHLIQQMTIKDAAAVAAGEFGLPKREVYARALVLAGKGK